MRHSILETVATLLLLAGGLMVTSVTQADKPTRSGQHGQSRQPERAEPADRAAPGTARPLGQHFGDHQRALVRDYYHEQSRSGRCPPGLAKKHNGCMPPGQARKWVVGRPLPREVIYYSLPPPIVVQLGAPPPGHRYVRVASDILLIAIGTGMVVDAIQDLGRP